MNRNDTYNTKQKNIILNLLKSQKREFTIMEIYEKTNRKVGLSTIYRLVDKLVDDNIISKNISKNNKAYYQYLSTCSKDNHFYLKCKSCGLVIHIDCDCIQDLFFHISSNHDFMIDKKQIIINGLCKDCIKKEGI